MTAPEGGIPAGEIFGYGNGMPGSEYWVLEEGDFSLSVEGEQVFLFCRSADGSPRPLSALSYNGNFSAPFLPIEQYDNFHSALPDNLVESGSIALPTMSNYVYNGPGTALTNDALRLEIQNPANWEGHDRNRFGLKNFDTSDSAARWSTGVTIILSLATLLFC